MDNNILDKSKDGDWIFRRIENKVRPRLAAMVPSWIETYHLTFMATLWTIGVLVFGYLAQFNINWLWLSSVCILAHYLTDFLDGTIGRIRNTGLIKWGYYMDHFLDYVFFTSLILSYTNIFPVEQQMLIVIIALIQIGFLVNIFLVYATTQKLFISVSQFGPSEVRITYVLLNIYLLFFGIDLPSKFMPVFAFAMAIALIVTVYFTQKKIWNLDMQIKNPNEPQV